MNVTPLEAMWSVLALIIVYSVVSINTQLARIADILERAEEKV